MKKLLTLVATLAVSSIAFADEVEVKELRCAGPYEVSAPVMFDKTDVNAAEYDASSILDTPMDLDLAFNGKVITNGILPKPKNKSISLLGFSLSNNIYTSTNISIKGITHYRLYVDGKQITGGLAKLSPAKHNVIVKCLQETDEQDTISITIDSEKCLIAPLNSTEKQLYTLNDVLDATVYTASNISPDGKYLISSTYRSMPSGSENRKNYLWNLATGEKQSVASTRWMPKTSKYLVTRKNDGVGYTLVAIDPVNSKETILTKSLPESRFTLSPTEDYVIYSVETEGPKESKDVFEVIDPDDRQPGWRDRSNLYKFDFNTGISTALTYGHSNIYLSDISQDGRYMIIGKSENDVTKMRPTTFTSFYRMDLKTLNIDTLFSHQGFVNNVVFSPDGKQILISGSPECLGKIGMNVKEGMTPNDFDIQLYLADLSKRIESQKINPNDFADITPLTRDFNPNVDAVVWSTSDNMIYFNAEDKDCKHLFRLNPKTKKIDLLSVPEEYVGRYSLSSNASTLAFYGQSATNADRLYTLNLKSLKSTLIDDLHKEYLADVELGDCKPYTWVNPEGDSICCRYYLPPHFDASKKYPMIVNYYGGCSPTSRTFGGRYAAQAYTALGYVVLVVNPRGATGFGQKWSAYHVNTAGKMVADDIIGSVKAFTAEHEFINAKKIGCIGASYGGFMTQYLQTQTDIFAAAVSHAGISDHTSYWGEGYWGYSYSQTSMANSYPWTRKDLYVDQSPLFNADKIHTPLLFVHGTGDTNVPVGESIQMYTALKLLGRPTAMVLVEGENHWIMQYQKRIKWQNTIWAWFAKWLQDDDSWWEEMYKHKDL